MTFAIRNQNTKEIMEHADTFQEALHIKRQYDEMGSWQDELESNEYYGTYEIIEA